MGGTTMTGGPSAAELTAPSVLLEAKQLITDEDAWTKGAWARDEDGEPVKAGDPAARAWCAEGALIEVMKRHDQYPDNDLTLAIAERLAPHVEAVVPFVHSAFTKYNDAEGTTHGQVLALLGAAAESDAP